MNPSPVLTSSTHTYNGFSEIKFNVDKEKRLTVTIDTERLHIRSITSSEEDLGYYTSLFGDPDVMCKYATGQTKTKEDMQTRINDSWAKRWKDNDPYSALAVFKQKNHNKFLGHVVLGYGDNPGESEIAYLFMKKHWKKGYGSESVKALVEDYAPATIKEGYLVEGKSLTKITATVRPDNPASVKIVEKVDMKKVKEEDKYGSTRYHYALELALKTL